MPWTLDGLAARLATLEARVASLEAGCKRRDERIAQLEAEKSSGAVAGADALTGAMGQLSVAPPTAPLPGSGGAASTKPQPADLTAWVDPAGGTAAAKDEFKMDFEGKHETVDAARARELITAAQGTADGTSAARTDFTRLSLQNKSYTAEGAAEVASVLRTLSAVGSANMADIIAGRMEEEALVVLKTLCDALAEAGATLRSVDLSDNALGEKGVRACGAILHGNPALEALWFNNNGISAECADVIREIVTAVSPTRLKLFHFHNNMSGPGGAASLAEVVRASPLLEDLRFSGTRCLSEGSLAFAKGVDAVAAAQRQASGAGLFVNMDLADNCFGEAGSPFLAKALAVQPNLRRLNLRDAGLGDEGSELVCKALLGTAPALLELELSGNDMTADAMDTVSECAASKSQLELLGLEENEIGSDGAKKLAARLPSFGPGDTTPPPLTSLSLSTNEISSAGALAVAEALQGFSKLTALGFNGNMFSEGALERLLAVLESNGHKDALGEDPFDENDESGDEDDA